MSALAETDTAGPIPTETGLPSRLTLSHPFIVGATMAAGGLACRISEQVNHTPLPNLVQEAVNSGAHPVVGFTAAAMAERLGADKLPSKVRVAAYMLAAATVNTEVEGWQDYLLNAPTKFWEQTNQIESGKDLAAAIIGAGIYKFFSNRRSKES